MPLNYIPTPNSKNNSNNKRSTTQPPNTQKIKPLGVEEECLVLVYTHTKHRFKKFHGEAKSSASKGCFGVSFHSHRVVFISNKDCIIMFSRTLFSLSFCLAHIEAPTRTQ